MILGISSSCEAAGEELDAGDHEPSLGAGDGGFEVLGQATVAPEPGEGALNHPSPRLGFESSDTMSSCDDLDGPFAEIGDRIEQFIASVDAVGEDVPQLGEAAAQRFEQWHGAMVVLHIGRVHESREQPTFGIGDDVSLAAFHLLGYVKPTRAAAFRGLHALTIDDTRRRRRIAPYRFASALDEI